MSDKQLRGEIKALTGRLKTLENLDISRTMAELRQANDELRKSNHELEQANNKFAVKLSKLQGWVPIALVVLGALLAGLASLTFLFIDLYRKKFDVDQFRAEIAENHQNIERYHQFEAARSGIHEVLIEVFQNKLGDTLDRISLLDASDEDKKMVNELVEMQKRLEPLNIPGEKFIGLSTLTEALKMIVTESNNTEAARALINRELLTSKEDRFVKSRARLLLATANFYPKGRCEDTDNTVKLLNEAIETDSSAVPAYNLRGVCMAERATNALRGGVEALEKDPELWGDTVEQIRDGFRDIDFAYQFKPSQWTKTRLIGNRMWNAGLILAAALPLEKERLLESLQLIGKSENVNYANMEEFFEKTLQSLKECQHLSDKLAYIESEAEIYGLACQYYSDQRYQDDKKEKANYYRKKMIDTLKLAIDRGLLKTKEEPGSIYFTHDPLLRPLYSNPQNPSTIDESIKVAIQNSGHAV